MAMRESGEMYLETIYLLSQKYSDVRAVDVCESLGYSKPSVSRAVGLLKREGLVVTDEHGCLKLTDAGEERAKKIYERHTVLTALLVRLGVDGETAAEDACRIEHYISDTSFAAIKEQLRRFGSRQ